MVQMIKIVGSTTLIYVFLVALLRLLGRRSLADLSAVDLVLMLCLGSAVETAMIRGDTSLGAGLTSAVTLLGGNHLLNVATLRSKRLRRLIVGGPTLVIHNGVVLTERARRCGLTTADLEQAVRLRQIARIEDVRFAVVEADGDITVVGRKSSGEPESGLLALGS